MSFEDQMIEAIERGETTEEEAYDYVRESLADAADRRRKTEREDLADRFGALAWCPGCSREVTPFDQRCQKCGTAVEELGTGDDDPYPGASQS